MDVLLASHGGEPYGDEDEGVLAPALEELGLDVEVVPWDADVDWHAARLVLVRSTWDYFTRRDEFLAWARAVEAGTTLLNPAEVLEWNTHKGYLAQLEERGAPIVPTAFVGAGDRVSLGQLAQARGWERLVVKPAVGAGSRGLSLVEPDGPGQRALDDLLAEGDALVQPFVPGVHDGELSIVLFDGIISHAVRKVPAEGEIRVQVEFGGDYHEVDVPPEAGDLATWVVEATGHRLLYARVDLLPDEDGSWMLAELEVAEPSLYLGTVPAAAHRLAGVVAARLDAPSAPVS